MLVDTEAVMSRVVPRPMSPDARRHKIGSVTTRNGGITVTAVASPTPYRHTGYELRIEVSTSADPLQLERWEVARLRELLDKADQWLRSLGEDVT
jgi:hypothetical protein